MHGKGIGALFCCLPSSEAGQWEFMAGTSFQTLGASCGAAGSMLDRIDTVPGCVMQIAFFVSVSILLFNIQT